MAKTNVVKWGNSLALRLPKVIAGSLNLEERTEVTIEVRKGAIVKRPRKVLVGELGAKG